MPSDSSVKSDEEKSNDKNPNEENHDEEYHEETKRGCAFVTHPHPIAL